MSAHEAPFSFPSLEVRGKAAGLAAHILIRKKEVTAEQVADKLDIRARILRDIAPAVGSSTTGHPLDLPIGRQRNVEWAADELEAAGELIRRLATGMPKTAQDVVNEHRVVTLEAEKSLLLRVLRARLSPLWVKALDVLAADVGMTSAMLADHLGVSAQQGSNVCGELIALGLVERKHIGSPHPDFTGPGRTPYWWTAVSAATETQGTPEVES